MPPLHDWQKMTTSMKLIRDSYGFSEPKIAT